MVQNCQKNQLLSFFVFRFCLSSAQSANMFKMFVTDQYSISVPHPFEQKFSQQCQINSIFVDFDWFPEKTARYHRNILRLPNLIKMQFEKVRTFFPGKKTPFLHNIFYFSDVQNFLIFLSKKLIISAGKTFLNNTIRYAF